MSSPRTVPAVASVPITVATLFEPRRALALAPSPMAMATFPADIGRTVAVPDDWTVTPFTLMQTFGAVRGPGRAHNPYHGQGDDGHGRERDDLRGAIALNMRTPPSVRPR